MQVHEKNNIHTNYFIIAYTCKKTFYKVELTGKVIDEYTGNPIEGVKVVFLGGNVSLSSSGPGYYEKTSVTTDSKGSFSFKFNANDNDAYALLPTYDKNSYFFNKNGDRPIEISIKKKLFKEKITQDIYLKRYSVLSVRFKQVSTDTMYSIGLSVLDNDAIFKMTSGDSQIFPAYMADFTVNYIYYGNELNTFNFNKIILPNYTQDNVQYDITIPKTNPIFYQINY